MTFGGWGFERIRPGINMIEKLSLSSAGLRVSYRTTERKGWLDSDFGLPINSNYEEGFRETYEYRPRRLAHGVSTIRWSSARPAGRGRLSPDQEISSRWRGWMGLYDARCFYATALPFPPRPR